MPAAPPSRSGRSERPTLGSVSGGNPCGSVPTRLTPCSPSWNSFAAAIDRTHRDEDGGDLRQQPLQDADRHEAERSDRERGSHRLAVGDTVHEPLQLRDEAVGVDGESEELRQLPDQDRQRQTVHVADHRRLRQQVGDEAELGYSTEHHDRAHEECEHRGERDGTLRVAVGGHQGQDRRRDHRPERRVRAEDEDLRRPEDRVTDQTEDRRVKAGDRREPCQLGIGHALWHEERGQDKAGDDVLGQPGCLVGQDHPDPRHCRHARSLHGGELTSVLPRRQEHQDREGGRTAASFSALERSIRSSYLTVK